mgnify:CR=1 FL=1
MNELTERFEFEKEVLIMPYNKEEGRGTQMKRRPMRRRKKVCVYCVDKNAVIDYKDTNKLKKIHL